MSYCVHNPNPENQILDEVSVFFEDMYFKTKYTDAEQRSLHVQYAGNLLCDQFSVYKVGVNVCVILSKVLYKLAFVVVGYEIQ